MCSYCGCEAEPAVRALMAEHDRIADLAYRARAASVGGDPQAGALLAEVAAAFADHSRGEEAGLFAQLRLAGEGVEEVDELEAQHRRLRAALADPTLAGRPTDLVAVLAELAEHAEREDDDLFPFALQRLPDESWSALARSG
ncbi:MAG TPA: hemerythrin domain-containing protein [Acidimicrobiales bacterium]|nr:hemerythrin domain-containing protein [Acidimicrobiales bacterium]